MGLIYMRTSPSGGRYIGKTTTTEKQRWAKHCIVAHSPQDERYYNLINCAIRKYGDNNFSVQILEENIPDDKLNDREIYWIDYHKTYFLDGQHGYNMTRGGDGSFKLQINENELLELWRNYISIEEICEHFHCCRSSITTRINQLVSKEERYQRRITMLSKYVHEENQSKIPLAIELWNQNKNIKEIAEELKINKKTVKHLLQIGGIDPEDFQRAKRKPILQFDLEGKFIREWRSAADAAQALNLHRSNISAVLRGENKTTKGYVFKYKENHNND